MLRRDQQEAIRQYTLYQPRLLKSRPLNSTKYTKYISELLGQKEICLSTSEIERMDQYSHSGLVLDCPKGIT